MGHGAELRLTEEGKQGQVTSLPEDMTRSSALAKDRPPVAHLDCTLTRFSSMASSSRPTRETTPPLVPVSPPSRPVM
jgi:hypothetical protein